VENVFASLDERELLERTVDKKSAPSASP